MQREREGGRGREGDKKTGTIQCNVILYSIPVVCFIHALVYLFSDLYICTLCSHAAKGLSNSVSGRIRYLEVENDGPDKPQDDRGPPVHDVCGVDVHQLYLK